MGTDDRISLLIILLLIRTNVYCQNEINETIPSRTILARIAATPHTRSDIELRELKLERISLVPEEVVPDLWSIYPPIRVVLQWVSIYKSFQGMYGIMTDL